MGLCTHTHTHIQPPPTASAACLPAASVTAGREAPCCEIEPRVNDLCKLAFLWDCGGRCFIRYLTCHHCLVKKCLSL